MITMITVFKIVITVVSAVVVCYLVCKAVQTFYNLCEIFRDRKSLPDSHSDCGGMVLNDKTHKLEADNKSILPF